MKRFRFADLSSDGSAQVASRLVPGRRIQRGGLSFHPVGYRTHPEEEHRHPDAEVFCIMQGRGMIEIDGRTEPIQAGDVLVIEPNEEHHIVGDPAYPIVNLWFHCDDEGHPRQCAPELA